MANFEIFHKLISYYADKSNNSPMPHPSKFTHPSLTSCHHIQPASCQRLCRCCCCCHIQPPLMASGSEGQGPHPQCLRFGSHSSLSCANEFDTTTMTATPQQ